ncbi:MAG: hypothetical protein JNN06_16285 [Gemmobacter sp.]|uniref:hypothetical protein n=1 Tax=Gemmobacter sp. TaxID=1898957 RepID=UPI001A377101|nr:hypothetical protein [Gemmobacter sp.]MBL8563828.1 hypothetical protein [Gemmobacter sp.]
MSITEDLADALARDVLAAMDEMDDERFYMEVGKMLASLSPSMEDGFMTAMRVRLAERRARALLERKLAAFRAGPTA